MTSPAGELPSQEITPPVPNPTDTFTAALPVLYELYGSGNEQIVLSSRRPLPAEHPFFPGELLKITPEHLDAGAPRDLGVWDIRVGTLLAARLATAKPAATTAPVEPTPLTFNLTVKNDQDEWQPATEGQKEEVASVLGLLTPDSVMKDTETKPRRGKGTPLHKRIGGAATSAWGLPPISTLPAY